MLTLGAAFSVLNLHLIEIEVAGQPISSRLKLRPQPKHPRLGRATLRGDSQRKPASTNGFYTQ